MKPNLCESYTDKDGWVLYRCKAEYVNERKECIGYSPHEVYDDCKYYYIQKMAYCTNSQVEEQHILTTERKEK